jgi:hypothetical protein
MPMLTLFDIHGNDVLSFVYIDDVLIIICTESFWIKLNRFYENQAQVSNDHVLTYWKDTQLAIDRLDYNITSFDLFINNIHIELWIVNISGVMNCILLSL